MVSAFRQASVSMSLFDLEQRYLRLNDTASQVMGLPEEALRGRFYLDTVPEDVTSLGVLRSLREVAETGRPVHYESYTRAPSGIREHAWNREMWPVREGTESSARSPSPRSTAASSTGHGSAWPYSTRRRSRSVRPWT